MSPASPGTAPSPAIRQPRLRLFRGTRPDSEAAQALTLRAWALHVLAGASPPESIAARAAACEPAAWDRFLRVERCALPLHAASSQLPARGHAALAHRRTIELKRVLSARAQLIWLGRVAADRDWSLAVLKGGAELAAGGAPLDLADVDVLASSELVRPLAALLDGSGYEALGRDAPVGAEGAWHLAQRATEGGIQVEVHYTVRDLDPAPEVLGRSIPLSPGLRRLAPADELWHLLVHTVSHHPDRRGNLRELLLLARAVARAGPRDRRAVEARAAAHPQDEAMFGVLRMGCSLAEGAVPMDEFRIVAAAAYAASAMAPPLGSKVLAVDRWEAVFASIGGDRFPLWTRRGAHAPLDSIHPAVSRLERALPPVGRGARMLQRAIRAGVAFGLSRPVVWQARRLCRGAEGMDRG